ncbi:MAG: MBOAT family protein [Limisphaerales bacterium]
MEARPIMDFPLLAASLSDFWGNRWNRGFNVPARRHLFLPMAREHGVVVATMIVFGVSGLLHEIVISVVAGSGFGMPTIYFLIQGAGVLLERKIASPWCKRLVAVAVVLLPVGLLFHSPFINNVMLPFVSAVKGIPWT